LESFFQMVINVSLLVKSQLIGLKHDLTDISVCTFQSSV
jgi:hypothetical protein